MASPRALRYAPRSEEIWSMAWSPTRVSPAPCSALLTGRPAGANPQTLEADGARSDGPRSDGESLSGSGRLSGGESLSRSGPLPGGTANRGLVSHNDVHPANLVFRDGRAVALIDFDLAGPGSAAWDVATAARNWAPLQDDQDITDGRQGRALERFRIFVHACGLTRAERCHVAEAVVANHDSTYAIVTEAAAAGHHGFADQCRSSPGPATRARRWCQRHRRDLLTAAR